MLTLILLICLAGVDTDTVDVWQVLILILLICLGRVDNVAWTAGVNIDIVGMDDWC